MVYDPQKLSMAERVCLVLEGLTIVFDDMTAAALKDTVYKYCHLANSVTKQQYKHTHDDWLKEFVEIEQRIIDLYYTAPADRAKT